MAITHAHALTGKVFGRLTVLRRGKSDVKHLWLVCRCSCPKKTVKEVRGDSLRNGAIRSCGCLHREMMQARGHHYKPGRRFGRLTIVSEAGTGKHGRLYLCRCHCGKEVTRRGDLMANGETKSCGCWFKESRRTASRTHGFAPASPKIPVYLAYGREKGWCENPRGRHFKYYMKKGIKFLFRTFAEFYKEVGDKPSPDHWLQRLDKNGHFERGNLIWIKKRRRKKRLAQIVSNVVKKESNVII